MDQSPLDDIFLQHCSSGNFKLLQDLVAKNHQHPFPWNRGLMNATKFSSRIYTSHISHIYTLAPLCCYLIQKGADNLQCIGDRDLPHILNGGLSPQLFGFRSLLHTKNRTERQNKTRELLQGLLIKDVLHIILSYVPYDDVFKSSTNFIFF